MVHCSNHCTCILTASGSSSCSEIVDHCLHKRRNPTCCLDQCDFLSDRNYAILRKICTKIFKEYNRAKCREKYSIFDGGNSINVRIHRSGTRANEINHRYEETSAENRHRLRSQHSYLTDHFKEGDKQTAIKAGKAGKKFGFDVYEPDVNGNKNPKLQGTIRGRTRDSGYNDNDGQNKSKRRDKIKSGSYNGNETNKEFKEKTATGKQMSKKRLSSEMAKSKSRNAKNNYNKNTDIFVHDKYSKKKKNKAGIKSSDLVTLDGNEITGKQNHKKKNLNHKSSDEIKKLQSRNNQKFLSADIKISEDYNIISNLRRKVRKEENFGFNTELSSDKMKKSKTSKNQVEKNLQYRKNKASRADEIKTCDYLRAQMEERELCKLCCVQQASQCIPYTCMPTYCPTTVIPCCL